MIKLLPSASRRMLKISAVIVIGAAVAAVNSSPASAFGHSKLREQLHDLTRPPAETTPTQTQTPKATPTPTQTQTQPSPQTQQRAAPRTSGRPPVRAQRRKPKRSITHIAGDVYQFKNNFHNSIFMRTRWGVVLVDPINKGASTWLKAELKRRWDSSVRYVIYSHDHADHISGGEVFADTAVFISHAQAKQDIIDEKRPTPVPDITFTDNLTLDLSGKKIELSYLGRNHSDNSIVVRFPAEGILHAVDFIPVRSLAFREMPDSYLDEWLISLKRVEAMEFDILSPGHGRIGRWQDVGNFRRYLEELRAAVTKLARAGKSADEVAAEVTMDKYKNWGGYKRMIELNVRGMYRLVQQNRRPNRRPRPNR